MNLEVPVLDSLPEPVEFYRNYVAANRPVIIKNAISHWPAIQKWNINFFKLIFKSSKLDPMINLLFNLILRRKLLGSKKVTATVTPNGYADAVNDGYFVLPEEKTMDMAEFLETLEHPLANKVFYIQKQSSNLTEEFPELVNDSASNLEWASKLFGSKPDAVNFWMGDERAVTSSINIT